MQLLLQWPLIDTDLAGQRTSSRPKLMTRHCRRALQSCSAEADSDDDALADRVSLLCSGALCLAKLS